MKKSDINPPPEYFERYISTVDDIELSQAFERSLWQLKALDKSLLASLGDKKYAAGKWTAKEIFQHIIDWERILAQRTLLFARGISAAAQNIDENLLAENINAERRDFDSLINELITARLSTKAMFESFDEKTMLKKGMNWKYEISVLAMGFTIIGHQNHHLKIIEEKYLPLV